MTEENVIYFNSQQFENQKQAMQKTAEIIQNLIDDWKVTTGTEIKTQDIPIFLTGTLPELKTLLFDKLTNKNDTDNTIFGIKVKKDKAIEMLDIPDIAHIKEGREEITHVVKTYNYTPENEYYEINKGKVKVKQSYEADTKKQLTIYAETDTEKARLKGFTKILTALNEMIENRGIDRIDRNDFLTKTIVINHLANTIKLNYHYIKTKNLY